MTNLSISKKLWLISLLSLAILITTGATNYFFTKKLTGSIIEVGRVELPVMRLMIQADMMHDAMRAAAFTSIVFADDQEKVMAAKAEYEEFSKNFSDYLTKIENLKSRDPAILQRIKDTRVKVEAYSLAGQKILSLTQAGKKQDAIIEASKFLITFEELAVNMEGLGDTIEQNANTTVEESQSTASLAIKLSLAVLVIGAILSLAMSFLSNKDLMRSLLSIIEGLSAESIVVGKTSQEMSSVANRLSEASTEQAASLQETVASIDEISAMVARNADSASSSAKSSEIATTSAKRGKERIEQMVHSIRSIASSNDDIIRQMEKTNNEISEIVNVIQNINLKTKVINDIVFQTKLLSFNASVEAARAGEHGKGFAVVAEEVGNLASMSGKAANEIGDMLSRSVGRVNEIVEGTKGLMDTLIVTSKQKIDTGLVTASDCAKVLDEILVNVSSVNNLVQEISIASNEQSTGVREVNKAMVELDQVTQSNSSISQESSHTSNDLKAQVTRIETLIHKLNVVVKGGQFAKVDEHKET